MNPLVEIKRNRSVTSSLMVAKIFEKSHKNVLRDIENLDCSKKFRRLNFELSSYKNEQNKKQPCYYITKDGFTFLVMGYRGKKAAEFKEAYIERFNDINKIITDKTTPQWIGQRKKTKLDQKDLGEALKVLADYAEKCGSKNGDKLYMTYAKLLNKIMGTDSRELSSTQDLYTLSMLINVVIQLIYRGIETQEDYHRIYKDVKERLEKIKELTFIGRKV